MWIEYSYRIGDDRWGRWFQRTIRLPTARLEVQLAFPAARDSLVWGLDTSPTAEARPIAPPPARHDADGMAVFTWNTMSPPLHAPIPDEWRFRSHQENH